MLAALLVEAPAAGKTQDERTGDAEEAKIRENPRPNCVRGYPNAPPRSSRRAAPTHCASASTLIGLGLPLSTGCEAALRALRE